MTCVLNRKETHLYGNVL